MRTTLTIDDDILAAARDLADHQRKNIGQVISALARQSLAPAETAPVIRNGIRLLPVKPGGTTVTLEIVNKLRDELP